MKKIVLLAFVSVFFSTAVVVGFIRPVKSEWTWTETIYIRADGSVEPDTAPISTVDNITYTLTDNIVGDVPDHSSAIVVERDNIVVDGAGYTLQGSGAWYSKGIEPSYTNNVTLENLEIQDFHFGIDVEYSNILTLVGNTVKNNYAGIQLSYSNKASLAGNTFSENELMGIYIFCSNSNVITDNIVSSNEVTGISFAQYSGDNTLVGNTVTNNLYGIHLYSNNNVLVGNNASSNDYYGIWLQGSSNSNLTGNTASDNGESGIYLSSNSNNTLVGNTASSNNEFGIFLLDSSNNSLVGNTVKNNDNGIRLVSYSCNNTFTRNTVAINNIGIYHGGHSSNNTLFHNSLFGNTFQAEIDTRWANLPNTWDNGYEGNYWSDYDGTDLDGDGIGDTSYVIDEDNRDRYPLMTPTTPPPLEHELDTSINAPTYLQLGNSFSLNATVYNLGLNVEVDVELVLLINGTIVDSTTIPLLQAGDSHTLSYLWTPTDEGAYNVTAHVPPLPEEGNKVNNQNTKFTTIWVPVLGVKAGDWVKMDYTVTGSGYAYPEWLKVEILSVEVTTVTVRLTMHMSNGTEGSETLTLDVARTLPYDTGGAFDTLFGFGFVILPNSTVGGDYIYIMLLSPKFMLGGQIDGETTGTYAEASRTTVYKTFSYIGDRYGNKPLKYYWDKQTGVIVEASATLDGMTVNAKVTETNMWEAAPEDEEEEEEVPFWMQWWLWTIVAVVIAALAGAVYFLKKRKPPTPTTPPQGTELLQVS